ncbi:TOMM precursor leader peptide-binding protein [Luteipulveratus sp. YIM 133132]|uniref:TOMM leader peptide-binding protein n=1 Tax=Luteipulveratus flavus TaxID=3031728 RepID=A0ABT6C8J6_9MICO|nr:MULTISPECIES: TOMM precursor leader peptide-binding protein [unclassified Luteipulveratus]MDE9365851.1 TOMM precursor leader peptide-binding protein [Luteipulveratus sp. YIM 133132]MDF8265041.1 TOMM precursor leader peptide-binding protein [Luteipulveratus sp. YIM 133296]
MTTDIPPHLVPLRATAYGPDSVHVSLSRLRAMVLDGLAPAETGFLLGLGATSSAALRAAAAHERTPDGARSPLERLARAAESAASAALVPHRVAVTGSGAMAAALGELFATGRGTVVDPPSPGPHPDLRASGAGPAIVICVSSEVVDLVRAQEWRATGTTVVPVVERGDRVAVGPVLRPGRGPCARCLELYQVGREPGRAALAAALLDAPQLADGDPALTALAAGLTALTTRSELAGSGPPDGVGLVASLPSGTVTHHRWPQHPECSCVTMAA